MEDEAVLDRGASLLKHLCDEEEVEGEFSFSIAVSDNENLTVWGFDPLTSLRLCEDTHWVKQEG